MEAKIDREVLESCLHCPYKVHLALSGERAAKSDYELMLTEATRTVALHATEKLLASHRGDEVRQNVLLTSSLLSEGAPYFLGAVLESDTASLRFDGLRKVAGASALGSFRYAPLLFHGGRTVRKQQKLLLELYGLFLGGIQGCLPTTGIVYHGTDCRVRSVRLFSGGEEAQRLLSAAKQFLKSNVPPRLILKRHCGVCGFRQRCRTQAVKEDNISLLQGMSEKEVKATAKKGIFTLTQLAYTFRPRRRGKRRGRARRHYHSLQAMAIRDDKVYVLGTRQLPSSPVHIYLDVEGMPDEGYVYLIGMVVSDGNSDTQYSFWADSKEEETRILKQFLAVVAEYSDCLVFCYGAYDKAFLKRMRKKARKKRQVDRVLDVLVNTLSLIYTHLYFPCYSNGLKDIGRYLGCSWTDPGASGTQSIVWRTRWEATHADSWKERLLAYNLEDCRALKRVTEFIYGVNANTTPDTEGLQGDGDGQAHIARVDETSEWAHRRRWGRQAFVHADFDYVNNCGYFDYQRQKVYVRTSKTIRRAVRKPREQRNRKLRVNERISIVSRKCPRCGSGELLRGVKGPEITIPVPRVKRAFDLVVTSSGLRRKVIECRTSVHRCQHCGETFVPKRHRRLAKHFHGLKSWAVYQHVAHRISFGKLQSMCGEFFGLHVHHKDLLAFKSLMAHFYRATYRQLWGNILSSPAMHVDETKVKLQTGEGYVWVFTSLEDVIFMYRPTREGGFLAGLLGGFEGVLVSDFYAAYDPLPFPQQKCLIHLIRDMNQDLLNNPYDAELRSVTEPFGALLRGIVESIDSHGLKRKYLQRHEPSVEAFFCRLAAARFASEAAEAVQKRLTKCQGKLFTFLRHDGVSWNNNNAENAVKRFAYYRADTNGMLTEAGLTDYLLLLSICETCRYRGASFFRFLLSRDRDMVRFCEAKRRRRRSRSIETYPKGFARGEGRS
ncbi:TM0106 family RecB-like putative nuclease [Planctomycetota bacterium]